MSGTDWVSLKEAGVDEDKYWEYVHEGHVQETDMLYDMIFDNLTLEEAKEFIKEHWSEFRDTYSQQVEDMRRDR